MKKIVVAFIALFSIFTNIDLMAQNFMYQDVSVFPKAEKGMQQWIINVPHSDSDEDKKVELYVGINKQVDACNHHFLSGTLETKNLSGWGYDYYVFTTNGNIGGTLMGCGNNKTISKFITAQPQMLRYNGRLPIVVYVPEGYEVKYKIYKAEADFYKAAEVMNKK